LYSIVSVWPGSSCSSATACAQNKTLAGNSRKGSRGLHSLEIEIRARRFEGLSRGFGNAGDLQHHRDPEAALQETPAERPLTRLEGFLRSRLSYQLDVAEAIAQSALNRHESRGATNASMELARAAAPTQRGAMA
jgi:succinate dehydrogenase/fumarate reductase flavoprotein subunit